MVIYLFIFKSSKCKLDLIVTPGVNMHRPIRKAECEFFEKYHAT